MWLIDVVVAAQLTINKCLIRLNNDIKYEHGKQNDYKLSEASAELFIFRIPTPKVS